MSLSSQTAILPVIKLKNFSQTKIKLKVEENGLTPGPVAYFFIANQVVSHLFTFYGAVNNLLISSTGSQCMLGYFWAPLCFRRRRFSIVPG